MALMSTADYMQLYNYDPFIMTEWQMLNLLAGKPKMVQLNPNYGALYEPKLSGILNPFYRTQHTDTCACTYGFMPSFALSL